MVGLWAQWGGPGRMIGPVLGQSAGAGGRAGAKGNTDGNHLAPVKYGVRGIANLILVHNGEVVDRLAGALPKPGMDDWLNRHMA